MFLAYIHDSLSGKLYIYIYFLIDFYCISSDFSDFPYMTDEYIDLSALRENLS